MSNLIPTPRTDKNGVTRIRHLKPEAAKSAPRKSIPRVAKAAPVVEGKHVALAGLLMEMGLGVYRSGLQEKAAAAMDETRAAEWIEFLKRDHGKLERNQLSRQVMIAIENPKHGKPLLDRIYNYLDDMLKDDPKAYPFSLFVGLDDYKRKKYSPEQELALLKVADAVSHLPGGATESNVPFPFEGYSISDPKLRDIAASRLDRTAEIVDIIQNHKLYEGQHIEAILDSGVHRDLQDGVL